MDFGTRALVWFLVCQITCIRTQEETKEVLQLEEGTCSPGFQVREYQVEYVGRFLKDQPLLQVVFDDCAGSKGVAFEVSNPDFLIDKDWNLIPRRDVTDSDTVIFVHGLSPHADDTAQVDIIGAPPTPTRTLRDLLVLEGNMAYRTKRSLLVPPMFVPENQRAPFPRSIGKSHVISSDMKEDHIFRLSGKGADQDPKGVFSINRLTGEVAVSRALDREALAFYHLQVSTTDMSGKLVEGPVDLDVHVIDQNDNRPIFREPHYSGEVLEGSPTGTTVMTMTAFDADDTSTDNAVLRYNILRQQPEKPSPNMFYIDPERGNIVTVISPSLLDRETLPTTQYELEIVAKDMAGSEVGLTGTATATITITDRNDHAPEFTHSVFQASVDEGSTGVVVNLTVDDRDDPATGAWRSVYSIINGDPNQSFEIHTNPDNNEGMLSVVKPLDYENTMFHTLLIKVENEDSLVPGVVYGPSSTATVYISVQDVNEGPVFFPDPLMVTKWENIPAGSFVAILNATDPDYLQVQSIRFSVLRDPAGWLSVNPVKGSVNTTGTLDRESPHVHNNRYSALFIASDNGDPPATGTGTLVITLEDENDNAPYVQPAVARVCEDAKEVNVAVIGARDRDIHPNADPFKIELGRQPGLDKTWRISRINNTHSQIALLHRLKEANYNVPLVLTDSGFPPLSNTTELKVQVCNCKKSRMQCSGADSHLLHARPCLPLLLPLLLLSALCL
ncbi:cadherin-13 isoform X1 [Electrophorus electricus]|uniref:cadherin-13 isoform X1 n=1 Tax=Electrophorus electricus TaxID=8005 RepID=UPI0015CFBA43|nr:cadherin-13 isoform X1 [Electrophorus electricus]